MDDDALVEALRAYGVRYLSGGTAHPQARMEPEALMVGLAQSRDPLLRQALTALFLVHPELAPAARRVAEALTPKARQTLVEAYVAAVYLQALWRTRLRRFLGEQPALPQHWIGELGLPDPAELDGRLGLTTLDARRGRRGPARGGRSEYERTARNLFGQLLTERAAAA